MGLYEIGLKSIREEAETLINLGQYLDEGAFLQAVDEYYYTRQCDESRQSGISILLGIKQRNGGIKFAVICKNPRPVRPAERGRIKFMKEKNPCKN